MQLMIAVASLVAGRFLEAAGPVVNVALLAGVSALLADAIAAALARRRRLAAAGTPLFLVASAGAVPIPLNPGLNGEVVVSSFPHFAARGPVVRPRPLAVEMLTGVSWCSARPSH